MASTDVMTQAAALPSMSPIQTVLVSSTSLIHLLSLDELDEPALGSFGLAPSATFLATSSATS